jgi:hypothetical protein
MSLGFYMDEQVPRQITEGLRRRGVDVLTIQDDGRTGEDDPEVLDRAREIGRVLFTRDDDFLAEAARRQSIGERFSGVVYAHQLRVTIGQCIADLETIADACDLDEFANRVEYLPL